MFRFVVFLQSENLHFLKNTHISYFLQTQIRRFGIPLREIGVSDKNIPYLSKFLTLLVKAESYSMNYKLAVLLVQNFHGMSLSL